MSLHDLLEKYKPLNLKMRPVPVLCVRYEATFLVDGDEIYYRLEGNVKPEVVDNDLKQYLKNETN